MHKLWIQIFHTVHDNVLRLQKVGLREDREVYKNENAEIVPKPCPLHEMPQDGGRSTWNSRKEEDKRVSWALWTQHWREFSSSFLMDAAFERIRGQYPSSCNFFFFLSICQQSIAEYGGGGVSQAGAMWWCSDGMALMMRMMKGDRWESPRIGTPRRVQAEVAVIFLPQLRKQHTLEYGGSRGPGRTLSYPHRDWYAGSKQQTTIGITTVQQEFVGRVAQGSYDYCRAFVDNGRRWWQCGDMVGRLQRGEQDFCIDTYIFFHLLLIFFVFDSEQDTFNKVFGMLYPVYFSIFWTEMCEYYSFYQGSNIFFTNRHLYVYLMSFIHRHVKFYYW